MTDGTVIVRTRRVPSLPRPHGFVPLSQAGGDSRIHWRQSKGLRTVLWDRKARLRVSGGRSIRIDTIQPYPHLAQEILNLGLALLLAGRGYKILHAGALSRPASPGRRRDCVVVIGPPGAGKSSLILAGALRGMEVVSDEIVPFRRRRGVFFCPGSNPEIRVDPAALSALAKALVPSVAPDPRRGRVSRRACRRPDKTVVDVRRIGGRCAGGPSRLALLVFLGSRLERREPPFRFEPLRSSEALIGLLENTYNRRVLSAAERRRHLRLCAAVSLALPAYRLSVRRGIDNVAAAAGGLDDLLARYPIGSSRPAPARRSLV